MIARLWHGRTPLAKAEEYARFLERVAFPDYRATPGNRGVLALKRTQGEVAEFLLVSFWESMESIRRFAGPRAESARYYPEDDAFLLEKEENVVHYDVFSDGHAGKNGRGETR